MVRGELKIILGRPWDDLGLVSVGFGNDLKRFWDGVGMFVVNTKEIVQSRF